MIFLSRVKISLLCFLWLLSAENAYSTVTKKPNIVFVLTDNQSAKLLPLYGNLDQKTPHINRLAEEGVHFSRAFSVTGLCSSTRATLMTGLMPSQHGIHGALIDFEVEHLPGNWSAIDEYRTLPYTLKNQGYRTAMIGKWHIGKAGQAQAGFEHWITFPSGHTDDFWHSPIIDNGKTYTLDGQHMTDFWTEKAVEYIEDQNPEGPFYLQLNYNGPFALPAPSRGPAKNRFFSQYQGKTFHSRPQEKPNAEVLERLGLSLEDLPALYESVKEDVYAEPSEWKVAITKKLIGFLMSFNNETINRGMLLVFGYRQMQSFLYMHQDPDSYANLLSQNAMVDDGVGRIVAALKEKGLYDNTLIVYSSDQGMFYGQHGTWGATITFQPSQLLETAMHIPLIIKLPNSVQAGLSSDAMIGQYDIMPTILDLAGEGSVGVANTPGRSFRHILHGESEGKEREFVFFEESESRGIRSSRYSYWQRMPGEGENALFDVINDPEQRKNLINNQDYAQVVQHLSGELESFFDQYTNPEYDLWKGGVTKGTAMWPDQWREIYGDDWQPDRARKPPFEG